MIPNIIGTESLTVYVKGEPRVVYKNENTWPDVITAIQNDDEASLEELLDRTKQINTKSNGRIQVVDNTILIDGEEIPSVISQRIINFMEDGLNYDPLIKFWDKIKENPSYNVVQRLYSCLEHNHHPLLADGNFLAYKAVREGTDGHLWDIYTYRNGRGTFRNDPGMTVSVPRNKVDDNIDNTCSYGLHIASFDYAANTYGNTKSGQDVIVEVSINPANVVAIPRDYNDQKMRVSEYTVLKQNKTLTERRVELYEASIDYDAEDEDEDLYEEDFWRYG